MGGGSCPHERPMATFSTMSLYRVESLSGTSRDEIAGISYESGKAALKTALLAVVMMLACLLSRVVAKPIIHILSYVLFVENIIKIMKIKICILTI